MLCHCDCASESDKPYPIALISSSGADLVVSPHAAGSRSESGAVANRRGSRTKYRLTCPGSCGKISELSGATANEALAAFQEGAIARAIEGSRPIEVRPPDPELASLETMASELVLKAAWETVREIPEAAWLVEGFKPISFHDAPTYIIRFDDLCAIVSRFSKRQRR